MVTVNVVRFLSETRRQTAALSSYTHTHSPAEERLLRAASVNHSKYGWRIVGVWGESLTLMQQPAKNRLQRRRTTHTVMLCISATSLSRSRAAGLGPIPSALGRHGAPGTQHHAASFHTGLIDRRWAWRQPIMSQNDLTSLQSATVHAHFFSGKYISR